MPFGMAGTRSLLLHNRKQFPNIRKYCLQNFSKTTQSTIIHETSLPSACDRRIPASLSSRRSDSASVVASRRPTRQPVQAGQGLHPGGPIKHGRHGRHHGRTAATPGGVFVRGSGDHSRRTADRHIPLQRGLPVAMERHSRRGNPRCLSVRRCVGSNRCHACHPQGCL